MLQLVRDIFSRCCPNLKLEGPTQTLQLLIYAPLALLTTPSASQVRSLEDHIAITSVVLEVLP